MRCIGFAICALLLLGCSRSQPTPVIHDPDIRGSIIRLDHQDGATVGMFVQGSTTNELRYDQATIAFDEHVRVFVEREGTSQQGTLGNLREGDRVEVLFTGAVGTSNPVFARAIEVVVLR